ncbi:MAG: zinc ribbon domain-containing protein [Treponema sp.]|uniref:zinc ribbon domain-containing protein n=1 Tax=Treponema sp. TaxID=166 RepID=UPI00298ECBE2|nr:zinc ribbon domain-containing protein [Treponema sp.]MBR5934431.1 zinc ribbon domain-containing protein [Treponema sp.]
MKKQAKFFCENCGEEVAQNARFCKKCGRFFSAVRCPNCGKVGSAHSFTNGCPKCGYAEKGQMSSGGKKSDSSEKNYPVKNHFYFHRRFTSGIVTKKSSGSSLPVWIYFITVALLVFMIFLFFKCSR